MKQKQKNPRRKSDGTKPLPFIPLICNFTQHMPSNKYLVAIEQTEGIAVAEVLELQQDVTSVELLRRGDELVDELVVLLAAVALLAHTDVVRIVEDGLRVRADIKSHREALQDSFHNNISSTIHNKEAALATDLIGADTSASGVEGKFANRNTHAVRAQITKAKNTLTVSEDNDL